MSEWVCEWVGWVSESVIIYMRVIKWVGRCVEKRRVIECVWVWVNVWEWGSEIRKRGGVSICIVEYNDIEPIDYFNSCKIIIISIEMKWDESQASKRRRNVFNPIINAVGIRYFLVYFLSSSEQWAANTQHGQLHWFQCVLGNVIVLGTGTGTSSIFRFLSILLLYSIQ